MEYRAGVGPKRVRKRRETFRGAFRKVLLWPFKKRRLDLCWSRVPWYQGIVVRRDHWRTGGEETTIAALEDPFHVRMEHGAIMYDTLSEGKHNNNKKNLVRKRRNRTHMRVVLLLILSSFFVSPSFFCGWRPRWAKCRTAKTNKTKQKPAKTTLTASKGRFKTWIPYGYKPLEVSRHHIPCERISKPNFFKAYTPQKEWFFGETLRRELSI